MKKSLIVTTCMMAVAAVPLTGFAKEGKGEALFKQHCAVCHPDGGNVVNAAKTLSKKDRDANGVKTAKDIMGKMRKPGPGMTMFDVKTISNKDAKEIAEYVMKTFK